MNDQAPNYIVLGLLAATVVFIVLKVKGKVGWSWWWVFSPVLIYISIPLILLALCVVRGVTKDLKRQDNVK